MSEENKKPVPPKSPGRPKTALSKAAMTKALEEHGAESIVKVAEIAELALANKEYTVALNARKFLAEIYIDAIKESEKRRQEQLRKKLRELSKSKDKDGGSQPAPILFNPGFNKEG